MAIVVRWIGWHYYHKKEIYGMTVDGYDLSVTAQCIKLANIPSVHVILMQDKFTDDQI